MKGPLMFHNASVKGIVKHILSFLYFYQYPCCYVSSP